MKAIDYQRAKKAGQWVPERGQMVNYHSIIGGDVTSRGHLVESVFPAASGHMVAFISNKRAHVAIEALTNALDEKQ
jgi:hypothetical protein